MAASTQILGNLKLTQTVMTGYTVDSKSITTEMIADDAVTAAKLSDDLVNRLTTLEEQIQGVTGTLHFRGVVTALPDSGDYAVGDFVIFGNKEYVCSVASPLTWTELGDTTATDQRVTNAENDIDSLEKSVDSLTARVSVVAQESPSVLTSANTGNEMMTTINSIMSKLVAAGVFTS